MYNLLPLRDKKNNYKLCPHTNSVGHNYMHPKRHHTRYYFLE